MMVSFVRVSFVLTVVGDLIRSGLLSCIARDSHVRCSAWSQHRMLNELRASYVRINFDSGEPAQHISPSSLGFTGINPQNTAGEGVPFIGVTGYFNRYIGVAMEGGYFSGVREHAGG